ncbi:MAG: hypothetical protein M1819_000394 [Sarea resinae]|nr:MAG: hypothetical protein M1819_000394 [Sarea resinae]
MDFVESSFFNVHGPKARLPTPAEVRALSPRSRPVRFEQLDLFVKFGYEVAIEEAQCLWAVRKVFGQDVPVPEVYGWRVDEDQIFIYMQLIRGQTLAERWDFLSHSDKSTICDQLRQMIASLRRTEQDPSDPFIGSINRGALLDYIFQGKPKGGPFANISLFHDWLSWLPWRWLPPSQNFVDPYKSLLPDTGTITLTHCDLHRGNIIISTTAPPRVLAIVDWGQSGWYPDYWEYCKACYTAPDWEEWRSEWIPTFLSPRMEEAEIVSEYVIAMGSV